MEISIVEWKFPNCSGWHLRASVLSFIYVGAAVHAQLGAFAERKLSVEWKNRMEIRFS